MHKYIFSILPEQFSISSVFDLFIDT